MKHLLPFLLFTGFVLAAACSRDTFSASIRPEHRDFSLEYMIIGMGSNRFQQQPVLRIKGDHFVYTREDIWIMPGETPSPKDTLQQGRLRPSAIDSIIDIVHATPEKEVYHTSHGMSGFIADIYVSTGDKEARYKLFNTIDSSSIRINRILNTHLLNSIQKLPVMPFPCAICSK